jgi:phosphomannomutase
VIIPDLLQRLGCEVSGIHLETDGKFPREPEPIPENLTELKHLVRTSGSQFGIAVDPDVDRMALVDEHGVAIGEDYTLAFAVRAVLGRRVSGVGGRRSPVQIPPDTRPATPETRPVVVANLSTSLVVEDAARAGGARFVRAPVGESNVARAMIHENALIGGEGNGGVMLPQLHVGRDAPLGVALILQYLAVEDRPVSALVSAAPRYRILKAKVKRGADLAPIYAKLKTGFPDAEKDERDGLRLGWKDRWVHVRPSGTEPVIRMIAEAPTEADAQNLLDTVSALL